MSNRNKTKKYRGPSRAIDPRRAPGRPAQRGPDRFGYTLIAIGLAFVLVLIVVASIVQSNSATPTTTGQVPASNDPAAQAAATSVAATAAEVAFATQVTSLPTISPTDAQSLLAANNAKFVDVRATSQYDISHIQGASNVPYTDAQNRLSEFPKSGNLIIYCQWPNDEESSSVGLLLQRSGYSNFKVLKGGLDAWVASGGPVTASTTPQATP